MQARGISLASYLGGIWPAKLELSFRLCWAGVRRPASRRGPHSGCRLPDVSASSSVTPRGSGGRLPVAVSEGPPARLSLHVWSVFTPEEPLSSRVGRPAGQDPQGCPSPRHRLWAPLPPASHQPLSAVLCLLGPARPPCPAWTLTRPAASQPPGEPHEGSGGQAGFHELGFFQASWTCAAGCLWPENQPLYFLRLPVV